MSGRRRYTAVLAAAAAVLATGACVGPRIGGPLGADFGNAVSHNAGQHVIDPRPAQALEGAPDMDGARAAGALERYRGGQATAPKSPETSAFGDTR